MTKLRLKNIQAIIICCVTLLLNNVIAQVPEDSDLFQILKEKDSLMFDVGFNTCDLKQIAELLPDKFEFYHDKGGITTSKKEFLETLRKNVCSTGETSVQRILEEGSLEVFPLHDGEKLYGAIQTGRHTFGNTEARFTNLFLLKDGEWMPSRILSYDHKTKKPEIISDVTFIKLTTDEMMLYLGDYKFSPDFTLTIINEDGKLYGDAQGQKVGIRPYGNHRFLDESQKMKLTFLSNENGIITGLTMTGPNGNMTAEKIN